MPSYNVYLGDVYSGLDQDAQNAAESLLQSWFGRIVPSGTTAIVSWRRNASFPIQENELLVYFVRDRNNSVVRYMPGAGSPPTGTDGWTVWSNGRTASEVYVNGNNDVAGVAFHELMHNKLHLNDAQLHSRDGLAQVRVAQGTIPSEQNCRNMRAGLQARHPQWTGGWAAVSLDGL